MSSQELAVVNPLPFALRHYTCEVQATLDRLGVGWSALSTAPAEGMEGILGKVRMLGNSVQNERQARESNSPVLTTWPTLGLLEARLARPVKSSRLIAVHDPDPLRSQVGYGRLARKWASAALPERRPTLLVHSELAFRRVKELLPRHSVVSALHPILAAGRGFERQRDETYVLVAGQYKPARDVELLLRLGPSIRRLGLEPRIIGRGWPPLDGWTIDARFVSEDELDSSIANAAALLLPYSRYFQSGIAVRAVELGTAVVGRRTEFLSGLVGSSYAGLVDSDAVGDYLDAISMCVSLTCDSAHRTLVQAVERTDISWRLALDEFLRA